MTVRMRYVELRDTQDPIIHHIRCVDEASAYLRALCSENHVEATQVSRIELKPNYVKASVRYQHERWKWCKSCLSIYLSRTS